ncbi:MAG TPA: hypothetical protein DCM07_09995 [Planctomycetaceae bacterium]|nr:hypothetical protein [Planctomycetaceae bacterium]HBL47543.1 hypothetical protein [Planctomycetaceae bacterium]
MRAWSAPCLFASEAGRIVLFSVLFYLTSGIVLCQRRR